MNGYIDFRTKNCKYLSLYIHHDAQFNDLLAILKEIKLPKTSVDHEQIMFSLLELINNSLRAHREKQISEDIYLQFAIDKNKLKIAVEDKGGGFDPSALPYNLDSDISEIDLHDKKFQTYREKNGYKRFGMGIFITKKTFNHFRLFFLDNNGKESLWAPGKVKSTRIEMGAYLQGGGDD